MGRIVVLVVAIAGCASDGGRPPDDVPAPVAPRAGAAIVINEVAASGAPDWFELLNRSGVAIDLSTLVFVDKRDDFLRAHRFPDVTVGPGERYVQVVNRAEVGFALGKSDGLYLYGFDDRTLVDGVTWRAGASPRGGSVARIPDGSGGFVTVAHATRGATN